MERDPKAKSVPAATEGSLISSNNARLGQQVRGAVLGLTAAALFGLSTPVAKTLLRELAPVLLSGLLYLGAAIGLSIYVLVRSQTSESRLARSDLPRLTIVVLSGGVLGPVLMLFGLQRVSALTGSLLLNLEAPFTILLAVLFFGEHLGRYAAGAVVFVLLGALALRLEPGAFAADLAGLLLLAGACLCWALDNNLTQRLSLRDPFAIVRIKALGAGITNTLLGLIVAGGRLPNPKYVGTALFIGCLAYGISVVLDAYALRLVGAAREAAYFATAPFVGAVAAVAFLGDKLHWYDCVAMGSMVVGVALLLLERHGHQHAHPEIRHEHLHQHDAHHQHVHTASDPVAEHHAHAHIHAALTHDHPHLPDAHHRHRH